MFSGDGGPPAKRQRGGKGNKTKGKGRKERLKPEDVAEDKPELAAFLTKRREIEAQSKDRDDVNFWVCLVFQSQAQRDEFMGQLPDTVRVLFHQYVDGEALAEAVGIPVSPCRFGVVKSPLHQTLANMAVDERRTKKWTEVELDEGGF
jgi:hypothetical protein